MFKAIHLEESDGAELDAGGLASIPTGADPGVWAGAFEAGPEILAGGIRVQLLVDARR